MACLVFCHMHFWAVKQCAFANGTDYPLSYWAGMLLMFELFLNIFSISANGNFTYFCFHLLQFNNPIPPNISFAWSPIFSFKLFCYYFFVLVMFFVKFDLLYILIPVALHYWSYFWMIFFPDSIFNFVAKYCIYWFILYIISFHYHIFYFILYILARILVCSV